MAKQMEAQKEKNTKLVHLSVALMVGILSAVILAH